MIEYLLLWSGDMPGYQKTMIPAKRAAFTGHFWAGELWTPDLDEVRKAVPHRHRHMIENVWFEKHRPEYPAFIHLVDRKGNPIGTIYLQPIRPKAGEVQVNND